MLHALVESVSQLMGVLGGAGHAVGNFINNFLVRMYYYLLIFLRRFFIEYARSKETVVKGINKF